MPQHPPPVNPTRLKTTLKMAISKLKFLQEKKTALTKLQRRQLADLLGAGKESSATIRVENIIRDDITIELMEYCELYCELLLARIQTLTDMSRTEVDAGLKDAVASIIFCCHTTEVKELVSLGDQLRARYGPEFSQKVLANDDAIVPEKIVKRCDITPPSETLVVLYLSEIARTYDVPYSQLKEEPSDDEPGSGEKEPEQPISEDPLKNSDESELAGKPKSESKNEPPKNEFDLLKERFAALKR